LLGVVQLGRAAGFFPKNIINVLKSLLKHSGHFLKNIYG
jgi:hypothetical protein